MLESKYDKISNDYYQMNLSNTANMLLLENENVLMSYRPQKKAFVLNSGMKMMPIAVIWLLFDGMFILNFVGTALFAGSEILIPMLLFIIPFFAIHLMPVWMWIGSIVNAGKRWGGAEYVLTDKRVLMKGGMTPAEGSMVHYQDILSVELKIGTIDKMCGVGDIHIKTASGTVVIYDLENPERAYLEIQRNAEYARVSQAT